MKRLITISFVIVTVLLASCTQNTSAAEQKAIEDYNNGIKQIESYGVRMANSPYDNHLAEHGVSIKQVTKGNLNDDIIQHANKYNAKMKQLIIKELGKDIFQEARDKLTEQNAKTK